MDRMQAFIESNLAFLGEQSYVQAIAIIAVSFVVAWLFDRYVVTLLRRVARKTNTGLDNHLLEHMHRPLFNSVLLAGVASATLSMRLSEQAQSTIFAVLLTIALVLWTLFVLRLLPVVFGQLAVHGRPPAVVNTKSLPLFRNTAKIVVLVIAIYFLFSAWSVDMTAWLASAGIVGIAVGFAAKDTLANLFSGVFILADAPYKIGDFVVLGTGERGQVTHIGLRSTRLMTRDDIEITVPNSIMGNTTIVNESGGPHEKHRIRVKIGVAYGSDIDVVRETLLGVAGEEESVCRDPEPRVRFRQFGSSSLDFELLCWVDEPVLRGRVLDKLNCGVYKQFRETGIEIPYAKQDLYIKELPTPLETPSFARTL